MSKPLLKLIGVNEAIRNRRSVIDPSALGDASVIVEQVRANGARAVRKYAKQFGERLENEPLVLGKDAMESALAAIDTDSRELLRRVAGRIERFAQAQRDSIQNLDLPIPGGHAGHRVLPVEAAGCYAPGGRHPLPSSVIMTAVTARVAGCSRIVVASPSTDPIMLAAAAVAGADEYLAVGGPHAIAALAFGFGDFSPCDVIVGPGNKWVTAAKYIVSSAVGIDMLAGPSELLIIADETAPPSLIAADLLAQAEHDDDAIPMLVTTSADLVSLVERELESQLRSLSTAATARRALDNGFVCVAQDIDEACQLSDRIAAEHVEVLAANPEKIASRLCHAGGVFIGSSTAEVLGDYGAGPNHTLPTGGSARYAAGLSVIHFLRLRTWLQIASDPSSQGLVSDTTDLARLEGLEAHQRSAQARLTTQS